MKEASHFFNRFHYPRKTTQTFHLMHTSFIKDINESSDINVSILTL